MERKQAYVGLLVVFGHPDGEQTLGRIIVVNPARAKIETLESRAGRPVGTRLNVPFHLMRPTDDEQAPAT